MNNHLSHSSPWKSNRITKNLHIQPRLEEKGVFQDHHSNSSRYNTILFRLLLMRKLKTNLTRYSRKKSSHVRNRYNSRIRIKKFRKLHNNNRCDNNNNYHLDDNNSNCLYDNNSNNNNNMNKMMIRKTRNNINLHKKIFINLTNECEILNKFN